MEFIYADELKTKFSIFGHFYDLKIGERVFSCRSVLEIFSNSINDKENSIPCAAIVMMNPGSSKPLDSSYRPKIFSPDEIMTDSWEKKIIPARPDNAQYQIMRLMLLQKWKHVRILNLSDLRNGDSGDFSTEYQEAKKLDPSIPHSITHKNRHVEIRKNCLGVPVVIAAWGTTAVLKEAALSFLNIVKNIEGLTLNTPWYRYPSPYKKDQKIDWLQSINNKLANKNGSC